MTSPPTTGERFARVGSLTLAYETFGDPADPAVLLIMGLGSQMILWPEELCEPLAAAGYFVTRFDNRDVGRSTILDAPQKMTWDALNIPDPETPVGARGIGEPPVAAGCCAVLNALANALGDEVFARAPVLVPSLAAALDAGKIVQERLTANI